MPPQPRWGPAGTSRLTLTTEEGKQRQRGKDQNYQIFNDKRRLGCADIQAHVRSSPKTHTDPPSIPDIQCFPNKTNTPQHPQNVRSLLKCFSISPFICLQTSLSPSNNLNTLTQDTFSNGPESQPSLPAPSTYFSHQPQLTHHPRAPRPLPHPGFPALPNQSLILHNPGLKVTLAFHRSTSCSC